MGIQSQRSTMRDFEQIIEEESRMLLHNATAITEIETIDLFPRSMTMVWDGVFRGLRVGSRP